LISNYIIIFVTKKTKLDCETAKKIIIMIFARLV